MGFDTKKFSVSLDELFAGDFPTVTKTVTLLTGTDYPRGGVIGIITIGGKGVLVDSDLTNGAEVAKGILLDPVDATAADKEGTLALCGDFNGLVLTFGGTDVAADHEDAMAARCLYIHKNAKSVNP